MAAVPFEYGCNLAGAFVMDPNEHPVGWMTALDSIGLPAGGLKADLTVAQPVTGGTTTAVAVLEKFSWAGGVADPLKLVFHVSQENAIQIKALQQTTLKNITVSKLGWLIADYDQETKAWYEKSSPVSPSTISGTIQGGDNPALNVGLTGAPVTGSIDVILYKVTIEVIPAANQQYNLLFANSASKPIVKAWGLQVGTLAAADIPPAT
jgi:hypothetical protein